MKIVKRLLITFVAIILLDSCTKSMPKPPTNPYTQSSGSGCDIQTANCSGAGPSSNGY